MVNADIGPATPCSRWERLRDELQGDDATATGAVVDDDLLPDLLGQLRSEYARLKIAGAAGGYVTTSRSGWLGYSAVNAGTAHASAASGNTINRATCHCFFPVPFIGPPPEPISTVGTCATEASGDAGS
jgi:hypothetical protein